MRREEEPRKADCPGCHGDFTQNTAEHGNFDANSDFKTGLGYQREARLAIVLCKYGRLWSCCSHEPSESNNTEELPRVRPRPRLGDLLLRSGFLKIHLETEKDERNIPKLRLVGQERTPGWNFLHFLTAGIDR